MTTKPKAAPEPDEIEATPARKAPEPLSLHGMSAADAVNALRAARKAGKPVLLDAPEGRPRDSVVVDGYHYAGETVDKAWHFHPISLEMACRVAGWKVQRDGAKWRLS